MNRALLQQALDALQESGYYDTTRQREAIDALSTELAKPEPEPVGYVYWVKGHAEGALDNQSLKPGTPRKHKHADMIRRWLDDDSLMVEWKQSSHHWMLLKSNEITWDEDDEYRFKPKMIKCGDLEFPEPMRVAPARGDAYAVPTLLGYPGLSHWGGEACEYEWLRRGIVHSSVEAAAAHAKALIALTESKS